MQSATLAPETTGTKPPHLPALTGVRFFLALWVVLFHSCEEWRDVPALFALFSKGYVAVTAFFVLSGMILVYNYSNKTGTPAERNNFFRSRIVRLYPMYFFSIMFGLPSFIWYQVQTNSGYLYSIIAITAATIFCVHSWYKPWLGQLNPPSWSLSTEAFFYAFFPAINNGLKKLELKHLILLLLFLFAFNCFFIEQIIGISRSSDSTRWWLDAGAFPLFHLATFVIGMCIGYLGIVKNKLNYQATWGLLALPLLALLVFCMNLPQLSFVSINSGGYALFFGVFFLMLVQSDNFLTRLLSTRQIILLGEASYALYLLHWPLRSYLLIICSKLGIAVESYPHAFVVLYAMIAIAASIFCYVYIERPGSLWLRKWLLPATVAKNRILQPVKV